MIWLFFLRERVRIFRNMRSYESHRFRAHRNPVDYGTGFEYLAFCRNCGCEDRGSPAEFPELEYQDCEPLALEAQFV